ncbi:MAG TPA: hypothetical protein VJ728_16300, partial [Candidatus Binataceae bacterium]|nr:hypothetical protein [Candidatus Binataceae bacterium]
VIVQKDLKYGRSHPTVQPCEPPAVPGFSRERRVRRNATRLTHTAVMELNASRAFACAGALKEKKVKSGICGRKAEIDLTRPDQMVATDRTPLTFH